MKNKKKATTPNPTRTTTPPASSPVAPAATSSPALNLLCSILLIAYGYVTVLTPNWMAVDSK